MGPELLALVERAEHETSATEAMETTLAVARIAGGEDPVRFLLGEMKAEEVLKRHFRDSYDREMRLVDFVQSNELARHMVDVQGGEFVLDLVQEFLESLVVWHQDELHASRDRYRFALSKWCREEAKRRTGGST